MKTSIGIGLVVFLGVAAPLQAGQAKDKLIAGMIKEFETSDNAGRRAFLAIGLGGNGGRAVAAIPALRKALKDRDKRVQANVVEALKKIVGDTDDLAVLARALEDDAMPAVVRTAATKALAKAEAGAIPILRKALDDRDEATRQQAADSLVHVVGALGNLDALAAVALDRDMPIAVRLVATQALGLQRDKAIGVLRKTLNDDDAKIREAAEAALALIVRNTNDVVVLAATLRDADLPLGVRLAAINSLGRQSAKAVPLLRKAQADGNDKIRQGAEAALAKVLQNLAETGGMATLVGQALKDGDDAFALVALDVLAGSTGRGDTEVKQLTPVLAHANAEVRLAAARAVLHLDPELKRNPELLARAFQDKDPQVALRFLHAVAAGEAKPHRKILAGGLAHPSAEIRVACTGALLRIDPQFRKNEAAVDDAIRTLHEALKNGEPRVRISALDAVIYLAGDKKARVLVPAVQALVEHADAEVRDGARFAKALFDGGGGALMDPLQLVAVYAPESRVVVHLRLKTIFDLLFVKNQFLETVRVQVKQIEVLKPFALDPVTDVTSVTLAVPRLLPGKALTENEGLLILRGEFSKAPLLKLVEADGVAAVCLNPHIILVSNRKERLQQALDKQANPKVSLEFQQMLARADRRATFWLVSSLSDDLRKSLEVSHLPRGLTGITVTVDLEKGGLLLANFHAADAQSAHEWQRWIDQMLPLAGHAVRENAKAEGDNVFRHRTSVSGYVVHVRIEVPMRIIETFVGHLLRRN